jgi:hypothetical protein
LQAKLCGASMDYALAQQPNSRLRYRANGRPADMKAEGFKTILVYCVGPPDRDPRPRCWHYAEVPFDRLPDWNWYDVCAHFKCTRCGSVAWVDPRPNWSEVLDYQGAFVRPSSSLLIELCRMSISGELAKLIPIGEENAVSGLLLWKQLKVWSPASNKHTLRLMARDGLIERKQVLRGGHPTTLYFRSRS